MRRRHRLALGLVVPACVVVLALVVGPSAALRRLDALTADPLLFAGGLLAVAVVRPLLAWPTTLLAVAVGYAFGPAGLPFALVLIVVSSVPTFLFARSVGAESRIADAGRRTVEATGGVRGVTASRLAPAPSDVVSAGAGVAGVSLPTFVVGTAIGELPWAVAGVLAGASMEALTADSLAGAVDLRLVVAVGLVGALLVAGPAYRHLRGTPAEE
jgi:uncharacterized membrane protein YdjX (TVP38/TMEM64 family)